MAVITPAKTQLASLQWLRLVAAVSVVICHLTIEGVFGSFGVDIFFAISGFVIAMVVDAKPTPRKFITDRVTRIVPLYWLMTFGVFALAVVAPKLLNSTTDDPVGLVKSLFFIPYFKENGVLMPVFGLGWTLNYEMLFYAVAALALYIRPQRFMLIVLGVISALHLLGKSMPLSTASGTFLGNVQIIDFLLGMAAYRVRQSPWLTRVPLPMAVCLVVLCYAFMGWVAPAFNLGSYVGVLGLAAAGLVLAMYRLERVFVQHAAAWWARLGVFLGDASYAIYLSHYFVIQAIRKLVAPHVPMLDPTSVIGGIVAVACALVAGAVIYVLIDKPMVRLARKMLRPAR